jgi:hypothetical protein
MKTIFIIISDGIGFVNKGGYFSESLYMISLFNSQNIKGVKRARLLKDGI